mmetsp:Transcript_27675/g.49858  ORF Transcript_27675/g.49858 Transcript_27675/m.49858 type:complete len:163 (+) Transcript_27675:51-539(+)
MCRVRGTTVVVLVQLQRWYVLHQLQERQQWRHCYCCSGQRSIVVAVQLQRWCILRQFQERKATVDAAVAMVTLVLLRQAESSVVAALVRTDRNEKNEDKNRVLTKSSAHFLWLLPTIHNLPMTSPIFLSAATGAYSLGIVVDAAHPPRFSGTPSLRRHTILH